MKNPFVRKMLGSMVIAMSSLLTFTVSAAEPSVLRMVPSAALTVLDPVYSNAYITRDHAYLVFDTLFGTDANGNIRPQMVDKYTTSKDQLIWTFTLRDGLEFHDGTPVTSADVTSSLKRWSSRDAFGGLLAKVIASYEEPDARTFVIKLKEPFGVMLSALGKPSSTVPFIMPKRLASVPGTEQMKEIIGSGPYKFVSEEFKPGERAAYAKNEKYKPRKEPASGTTGAKIANFDRIEWIFIRDPQTMISALEKGEVDLVTQPASEHYSTLRTLPGVQLVTLTPAGSQLFLRFNHVSKPFDDVRIRRAAMVALGQEEMLKTQIGVPGAMRFCVSVWPCGTALSSDNTGFFNGKADPTKAARMLKEAGYDGTPVVLLRPTDNPSITKLPLMAKQQLEEAGFKVNLQQMDWGSLLARRSKKDAWSAYMSWWVAADVANPLVAATANATGATGWAGWQDDPQIEQMKVKFARANKMAEQKKIAEAIQLRMIETGSYVPLGQFSLPAAARKNLSGFVTSDAQVLWGIKRN